MNKFVFIKDLGIYGNVVGSWNANNNGVEERNYVIKDLIGIEHERFGSEIEFVDDINDSIKKAKCNMPLEMLIEKFNEIDRRFTLSIETSVRKEHEHSDVYVPFVFVNYGDYVSYGTDKVNKLERVACIVRDGKLVLPMTGNYFLGGNEYECCLLYYSANVKDVVFELYMNIITRLER